MVNIMLGTLIGNYHKLNKERNRLNRKSFGSGNLMVIFWHIVLLISVIPAKNSPPNR